MQVIPMPNVGVIHAILDVCVLFFPFKITGRVSPRVIEASPFISLRKKDFLAFQSVINDMHKKFSQCKVDTSDLASQLMSRLGGAGISVID